MILEQIIDGQERVIGYVGRILTKAERNYNTTTLEGLAVIEGVKHFQCYLYGHKFTVHTDHSSLNWLFKTKDLKGKYARWVLYLQSFDFKIVHSAGKENLNADALSRLQDAAVCTIKSNVYDAPRISQL